MSAIRPPPFAWRRHLGRRALWLLPATLALGSVATAQNGSVQFSARAYAVKESTLAAKIVVLRTGGSAGTVTVDFATVDNQGTAQPGLDYTPTNGTLTFGPGVTTRSFSVPIVNDTAHEETETVVLQLSNPSEGTTLGEPANATLTIADNDTCSYALNPISRKIDQLGGLVTNSIVASEGCDWLASAPSANWVATFGQSSGSGNGDIAFSCDPLPEGMDSRTATVGVAGKTFTFIQTRDQAAPTVTIKTPPEGSRWTNSDVVVTGQATDDIAVTLVEFRLENTGRTNDFAPATGTANWSAPVSGLAPGLNTIRIRAHDHVGQVQEATRSIQFVPMSPLAVAIVGEGTVSPLHNGQLLEVGKSYTVTAKAKSGNFFTGWSGSLESADNPVTFVMAPDFMLQANFIPSPFTAVAGVYSGLFSEDTVRHGSSGFLTVKVGPMGTFTAKVQGGGKQASFSGRFALDGTASNAVMRVGAPGLTVVLILDLSGGSDSITGVVSDGIWTAGLQAFRAVFNAATNPAPQAGHYTIIVPGDPEHASTVPGGDGFGAVTVSPAGAAMLNGTLADGTKITQKAALSKDGLWPIYAPLYGGRGFAFCWATFGDTGAADLSGTFIWAKPAGPAPGFYTNGLAVQSGLSGSRYHAPTLEADRVLPLTAGHVTFQAGNLADAVQTEVTVSADGKVTTSATNKMVFTIQKSSGLFNGSVTLPGSARSTPFRGAVHQRGNFGSGFFLGTDQSGDVLLSE